MKRIVLFVSLIIFTIRIMAQDIPTTIVDGIDNLTVKHRMEKAISGLLTEINQACAQERALQLDNIDMVLSGKHSLQALWKNLHFYFTDGELVERCLTSAEGYVIRNIYIQVNPMIEDYTDEPERALTIRLTREGQISNVTMSASDAVYGRIVEQGLSVTDAERRFTILSFVENYRSFYDEKDITSIERVFSDDAIIITGTVQKQQIRSNDMMTMKDKIRYNIQNKKEYINSLTKTFNRNEYIKVTFSDVDVKRHPANPDYYGVTLHQHWKSSTYEDDGYLLLVWEFHEGQDPIIHYRTWQPDHIGSQKLSEDEMISIMDFYIPQYNK